MPLSEHEQRLLDQIERALYAEDPKFASTVRSTDLRSHLLRRIKRGIGLLGVGLVVLVVGAASSRLPVGVIGFLVMLTAGLVVMRSASRLSGIDVPRLPTESRRRRFRGKPAGPARPGSGERGSLRERFEERWRRRWEDRGE